MSVYTLISLLILAGPLALSFDSRVAFYQYWPGVFAAVLLVGGSYLAWDVYMTAKGHWRFNPRYTGSKHILGLPLGEWLFFLGVPYACLFIYEVAAAYFGDTLWFIWNPWGSVILSVACLFAAAGMTRKAYTMLVLFSAALFFGLQAWLFPQLPGSQGFWVYIGISMAAFLIFNGLYTWLPTIHYQRRSISGLRVGTIPIEDFIYNFSMLGLALLVHLYFRADVPW